MTPDPYWRDEALCREVDLELFFPLNGGGGWPEAARICAACPVRSECLEDALDKREFYGFRGGMSGDARRRLASTRARPDHRAVIVRLHAKQWTPKAIGLRLGLHEMVVYRVLKEHRDAGGEAA